MRHLPGLPQDPIGVPHHLQAHHTDEQLHCSLSKPHLQPQQWESKRRGASRMWLDSTPMHATGCLIPCQDQPQCSPQGPTRKQVCSDLINDLGDKLPLPTDLAHFLGDTTDERINAPHPPALSTTSSPWLPTNSSDQHHANPMRGAWPKTDTALSSKLMAASQAEPRHRKYTRPHRAPWGVHPGTYGQEQVTP